jgi:hypothetical protein
VTWKGDQQFKTLKAKARPLPEGHDPSDRAAALAYTRETEFLTTGVLYRTRQPSLVERLGEVRRRAQQTNPVANAADILRRLASGF